MSGHAVGARLERDHVDAFGGAVRHRGALSRFEVQSVEVACQLRDVGYVATDHADEGARGAGETLEPDIDASEALRLPLLDDVGQDAVARRQLEAPDHLLEQLLEPRDAVDVVRRGVEADDDVAAAVTEALENREENLVVVV